MAGSPTTPAATDLATLEALVAVGAVYEVEEWIRRATPADGAWLARQVERLVVLDFAGIVALAESAALGEYG